MDGVGGASAEVTWQRYNGVRRAKFIPERERESIVSSSTTVSDRELQIRERPAEPRESRLSVQVYDKHRDHEIDVDVEKVTDRRISLRPQPPPPRKAPDTWTEITKDLILREAIEELGYQYEETEFFYYVMQYLRYVRTTFLPAFRPHFCRLAISRATASPSSRSAQYANNVSGGGP